LIAGFFSCGRRDEHPCARVFVLVIVEKCKIASPLKTSAGEWKEVVHGRGVEVSGDVMQINFC